jgi:hypothetical protein
MFGLGPSPQSAFRRRGQWHAGLRERDPLRTGAAVFNKERPTNCVVGQLTVTKRKEFSRELVGCLVLPEPGEPPRRKCSVSGRALQIPMSEMVRKATRIMSIIR